MAFLSPLRREDGDAEASTQKTTSSLKRRRRRERALPVLSDLVHKDDVVRLGHGDFGGVRRECHVIDDVALFPVLTKQRRQTDRVLFINTQPVYSSSKHTQTNY